MGSIKQIANSRQTFRQFLKHSEDNLNLLPICLQKCFNESDEWHTCTTDLLLFKKIFNNGSNFYDKAHGLEPDPAKAESPDKKPLNAE